MIARPSTRKCLELLQATSIKRCFSASSSPLQTRNNGILENEQKTKSRKKQNCIPASYYRGGTSRGLIFHADDLPVQRADWAPIFRGTLGSPDPNGRQLDGLGGGISSLSKICVVGPSTRRDEAQLDFTFVQVGIKDGGIDYSGNCGNLMSAIGPYAVDTGLVPDNADGREGMRKGDEEERTTVRIHNTNTGKLIDATFPVYDGEAAVADGNFTIDGVAGTGAKVKLDFLDPAGSKTGRMLPTGNVVDVFDGVKTTCVDVGNPCVFLSADEVLGGGGGGVNGTVLPDITARNTALLARLESIRVQATIKMGMASSPLDVPASIPKVCFVSPPSRHKLISEEILEAEDVDIVARAISVGQPHKALPITAGLAMSAAAGVEGSVVQTCLVSSSGAGTPAERKENGELVIGHPSGKLVVGAKFVNSQASKRELEKVTVFRTARRLMEGLVFWK